MVETRAPGTEQISQRVSYFCRFEHVPKRRKMAFFEGLVDGEVDQGPWLQERGVGRWQFQRRGRVGAWLAVPKRSKSREGVREGLAWRSGGVQGLRLRGGRWYVCRIFVVSNAYKKKKNGFF